MIINTGQRTDIPAFYAEWFANRIKEGFVCVRNPYNPNQVNRYRLDPASPFLIGNYMDGDKVHEVPQESWIDRQESLLSKLYM